MKTAIVKFIRNGALETHELMVSESVVTDDKDMLNLNVFRRMFNAELYDEVGITEFCVKSIK